MILTIENYNLDSKIPYSDAIYSMCEHYITELGIGNIECMLSVVLHDEQQLDGHMWGYCDWDVQEKLAEVHIAMKGPAWGLTLAHEMVHVKQYVRHELKEPTVWKGTNINTDKVEYWDLPWEIEAHGREIGLFVRWAQKEGYWGKKWTHAY